MLPRALEMSRIERDSETAARRKRLQMRFTRKVLQDPPPSQFAPRLRARQGRLERKGESEQRNPGERDETSGDAPHVLAVSHGRACYAFDSFRAVAMEAFSSR